MACRHPDEIFDVLFGGNRNRKSANVVHELSVTLEELYNGSVRKLAVQKNVFCKKCEGRGGKKGALEKCTKCHGSGMQTHVQPLVPGMVQRIRTVCSCQGKYINPKDRCETCHGRKVARERKVIEVHIDKGMKDGHKITLSGEGDQEPGFEPGDIIIVLNEKEHEVFKRCNTNLKMSMELTLTEALCGFQRIIPTLDNRILVISCIPGDVIEHQSLKCVLNEGMPQYKNPVQKGKLIIQFIVNFPDILEDPIIQQLEAVLPPRPRIIIPVGANKVHLLDITPHHDSEHQRFKQAYKDDDDHHGGPRGVQYQTH